MIYRDETIVSRKRKPAFLPSAPSAGGAYKEILDSLQGWYQSSSETYSNNEELWSYIVEIDLGNGMVRLNNPIKVAIENVDDGVVVFAPLFGLSGFGGDLEAATGDLVSTIIGLLREYSAAPPDRLHDSARVLLGKLRTIR